MKTSKPIRDTFDFRSLTDALRESKPADNADVNGPEVQARLLANCSLITWWDMEKFSAAKFMHITLVLGRFSFAKLDFTDFEGDALASIKLWTRALQEHCSAIGL